SPFERPAVAFLPSLGKKQRPRQILPRARQKGSQHELVTSVGSRGSSRAEARQSPVASRQSPVGGVPRRPWQISIVRRYRLCIRDNHVDLRLAPNRSIVELSAAQVYGLKIERNGWRTRTSEHP